VARSLSRDDAFSALLKATESTDRPVADCVTPDIKTQVDELLNSLSRIQRGLSVKVPALDGLFDKLEIFPHISAQNDLRAELETTTVHGDPAIRRLQIRATTISSSKGLAADLVIITHFDDRFFIRNKDKSVITDQDVCNFLVALTRARKKLVFLSTDDAQPTFLGWIDQKLIRRA